MPSWTVKGGCCSKVSRGDVPGESEERGEGEAQKGSFLKIYIVKKGAGHIQPAFTRRESCDLKD